MNLEPKDKYRHLDLVDLHSKLEKDFRQGQDIGLIEDEDWINGVDLMEIT